MTIPISDEQRERFRRDGVVHLEGALDAAALTILRTAFDWTIGHPGAGAGKLIPGTPGTFYGDLANPHSFDAYGEANARTPIPGLVSQLWNKPDVWYMYEQVFLKTGGDDGQVARRTPWHQDLPYLPVCGDDLAVVWIPFEALGADESLEFVVASHVGTLYDGSRFDPADDTIPLYGTGELPRLPDIEKDRSQFHIVSFATQPGDVVVFHPAMLHGGAPTESGKQRHTLSLRYFGDDARVALRPGDTPERLARTADDDSVHPMMRAKRMGEGAPFRDPGFPRVH